MSYAHSYETTRLVSGHRTGYATEDAVATAAASALEAAAVAGGKRHSSDHHHARTERELREGLERGEFPIFGGGGGEGGGGNRRGGGGGIPPAVGYGTASRPPSWMPSRCVEFAARLKRKKKPKDAGIVLTKDSAMELEYQVHKNLVKHNISASYYYTRQMLFFTIPQAVLTMVTSILAFLSSSELYSERQRTVLATIVGCLSGVVVFLQTLNGVCTFGTRAAQHASAAIDLRDLRDHIILIKFTLQKQEEQDDIDNLEAEEEDDDDNDDKTVEDMLSPKDDKSLASYDHRSTRSGGRSQSASKAASKAAASKIIGDLGEAADVVQDEEEDEAEKELKEDDNTFGRLQQRYRQSLAGCKSNIPMQVSEAFSGMESNLMVMNTKDRKTYMVNVYGPKVVYDNLVYFKAFDILSEGMLNYWLYPLFLPNPTKTTQEAMDRLGETLDEYHNYWDAKEKKLKRQIIEEIKEDNLMESQIDLSEYEVSKH